MMRKKRKLQSQVLNYEKDLKPFINSLHFNLHSIFKKQKLFHKNHGQNRKSYRRKTKDRIKLKEKET